MNKKTNDSGKKEEWEEMFAHLPELKRLFAYYERQIRFYNRYEWGEGITKESLIQKRDALLGLVKRMGNKDLLVLYYLRRLKGITVDRLLHLLHDLYQAEQALYGELKRCERGCDPMMVVPLKYKKFPSNENPVKS